MTAAYYRRSSGGSGGMYDMSSYVAVAGTPQVNNCNVFGLTPQEVRYLKGKFQLCLSADTGASSGQQHNPHHGIRVEATTIVVLNALGYIGFKVIATSGDVKEYLWTLERNLDADHQFRSLEESYQE